MTVGFIHPAGAAGVYRPDIDGLRAIAVIAVVLYHFFPGVAPGGYIGVDIFFVISGYLISSIIINELNDGRFSFMAFYRRRARRIFPALVVVLAASAAFGWLVLFENEYKLLGTHVFASSAFVLNFVLWRETGYFEIESSLKPLLHLWSLSVEEQFYVVWPLLLWLAWKWKRGMFAVALAIGALSFLVNTWGVSEHSVASFFLMLARLWEFLAGYALACAQLPERNPAAQAGGGGGHWPVTGDACLRRTGPRASTMPLRQRGCYCWRPGFISWTATIPIRVGGRCCRRQGSFS